MYILKILAKTYTTNPVQTDLKKIQYKLRLKTTPPTRYQGNRHKHRKRFTLLRSPHAHKKSLEHFQFSWAKNNFWAHVPRNRKKLLFYLTTCLYITQNSNLIYKFQIIKT